MLATCGIASEVCLWEPSWDNQEALRLGLHSEEEGGKDTVREAGKAEASAAVQEGVVRRRQGRNRVVGGVEVLEQKEAPSGGLRGAVWRKEAGGGGPLVGLDFYLLCKLLLLQENKCRRQLKRMTKGC